MKEIDKGYLDTDKALISEISSNAQHDEYLNDKELKTLFSQQIRKMMSK